MKNSNFNKRFGHCGLEFVLNCSTEQVEAKIRELSSPNRRAKEERDDSKGATKLAILNRMLHLHMGTPRGEKVEAQLNQAYRNLHKMRMKS